MALPAYQTPCSATTMPSVAWDCPALPAHYKATPMTTAAGINIQMWIYWEVDVMWQSQPCSQLSEGQAENPKPILCLCWLSHIITNPS